MMDLLWRRRAVSCGLRLRPSRVGRSARVPAELPIWLERVKTLPDIRWDKVARIRQALQAGLYDVDARLDDLLTDWPAERAGLAGRSDCFPPVA